MNVKLCDSRQILHKGGGRFITPKDGNLVFHRPELRLLDSVVGVLPLLTIANQEPRQQPLQRQSNRDQLFRQAVEFDR
jgi:hypothetical protein